MTTKSKNFIDHFITQNEKVTQTLTTTIRDCFTVLAAIPVTVTESKICEKYDITRNLNNLRGDTFLNFLFLKSIPQTLPVDEFVSQMIETITFCVNITAPEKNPPFRNAPSIRNENQWITNKIKNAMKKRDRLYQIWLDNSSTENRERYRHFRNYVTQLIRESKREETFRILEKNSTAKTIYKTLVTVKKQQQPHSSLPDLEDLKKYLAAIGSILS